MSPKCTPIAIINYKLARNKPVASTNSWPILIIINCYNSVPARLGKGQGAKEIGHILAHKQPKFGHNLVRKRHNRAQFRARMNKFTFTHERRKFGHNPARKGNKVWAQFCGRSMKTWVQICKHFTSIFTSAV